MDTKIYNASKVELIELFKQLAIKSFDNSLELYDEAKILFKYNKYHRSFFLAQIGCEELGKHLICTSAIINTIMGRIDRKRFIK